MSSTGKPVREDEVIERTVFVLTYQGIKQGIRRKIDTCTLRHAEPEMVQQAVYILTDLKVLELKSLYKALLSKQTMPFLKMENFDSLSKIRTPEARNFIIKVLIQTWLA